MAWAVSWKVVVDGNNVTAQMRPTLISITVQDKDGTASDTCNLTFDDTNGRTILPRDKASLVVYLQGLKVFEGEVNKVQSKGSRGSGRTISVNAKGFDTKGKVKDGQRWHKDDATLDDVLNHAAKKAGLESVKVDPELASITRPYWSPDGASFLAYAEALAREHQATFKIRGKKAVFFKRGKDAVAPVIGVVGDNGNVISWDITPTTGRRKFKEATARYFNRETESYETEALGIGSENAEATNAVRATLPNKDQAKENLKGRKTEAEREGGEGNVALDLEPGAQAEAVFTLTGAREGVDGSYRVVSVTHSANRSGGSKTKLELKQPKGS